MKTTEYISAIIMKGRMTITEKEHLIKDYAKQVAQKALNDAAENAKINVDPLYGHKFIAHNSYCASDSDIMSIDKESITRTEILTP